MLNDKKRDKQDLISYYDKDLNKENNKKKKLETKIEKF